jgi:iron(III) transport system substrate-binding protein
MKPVDRRAVALGLAAAPFAAGARAQAPDRDALIAAAKREGKVVVYSGYLSAITHEPIGKLFDAKYGIKIEVLTARGNELRERIRIEQQTGRYLGDVQHNASSLTQLWGDADHNIEPLGAMPNVARLKPDYARRADRFSAPIFTIMYGFLVNNALVPAGQEPKSWRDLLEPKWAGKILFDDPRAPGGGRVMFQQTLDKYGREFHETLAKLKPTMSRDYGEAVRRIARGEFAVYVPLIFSQAALVKGLPVRDVVPEDGVIASSYSVSVLKNAPHPNAARLLADFYLSDEVQEIYARTAHGAVVDVTLKDTPPEIARFAGVKPLMPEDNSRIDEYLALAKEIYL